MCSISSSLNPACGYPPCVVTAATSTKQGINELQTAAPPSPRRSIKWNETTPQTHASVQQTTRSSLREGARSISATFYADPYARNTQLGRLETPFTFPFFFRGGSNMTPGETENDEMLPTISPSNCCRFSKASRKKKSLFLSASLFFRVRSFLLLLTTPWK